MKRVLVEKKDGELETIIICKAELHELLKKSSDADGVVQKQIVVFQDAFFDLDDKSAKSDPFENGIPWILSDFSEDRDQEKIDPKGWQLKNYKKNPIMLWSHDYYTPAIGKILSPRIKDDALQGKALFDVAEVDEFAAMIGAKVASGTIRAGSVGFRSIKIEIIEDDDEEKSVGLIHRKQELYEYSIVNIPSNVNSLAQIERDGKAGEEKGVASNLEDISLRLTIIENSMTSQKSSYIDELLGNIDRETSDLKNLFPSDNSKRQIKIGGKLECLRK